MIHETAIIGPEVRLSSDVYIGPYCNIQGRTVIEAGTRLEGFCSIGTPAEHREFFTKTDGICLIGRKCIIREFVTINAGTTDATHIQDKCIFLKGSHVGHDSVIESEVTVSCSVLVGGFSYIMKGANLGLGAVLHQYSVIGAYSMVGMNSTVTKSNRIKAGNIYAGNPARLIRRNAVGLERAGVTEDELEIYHEKYLRLLNGS